MKPKEILFFEEVLLTWSSGGWLMLPLLALIFYLYYHALLLWLQLEFHFLIQSGIHKMSDREISSKLEEGSLNCDCFGIKARVSKASNAILERLPVSICHP